MKKIDLETMKQLQIEMLKYIDRICKKNNIEYFLVGGSLIGAVRHNGFIPWDDDIDIALTYKNYQRLYNVLIKDNDDRYKIMNHDSNSEYFYPYAKLIDTKTILHETNYKEIKDYGVYVDIFTYYNLPNDENRRIRQYKKIKNIQRQIFYYGSTNPYNSNIIKNILKIPLVIYSKKKGIDKILKNYNKILSEYSDENTTYVISNWPLYKMNGEIQKFSSIKETTSHKFESMQALIPINYDEFLKTTFGDYMKLPPESERVVRHINEVYWRE